METLLYALCTFFAFSFPLLVLPKVLQGKKITPDAVLFLSKTFGQLPSAVKGEGVKQDKLSFAFLPDCYPGTPYRWRIGFQRKWVDTPSGYSNQVRLATGNGWCAIR